MYHYLGRPLEELLEGEPSAPLVVKQVELTENDRVLNVNNGRLMVIRILYKDNVWEITTAYEQRA